MERKKIYVFDFDGTLTTADTLLEFIRFACGRTRMLLGFALYAPWIVLMKLHLYPNYKAKQKVFAHFFGGMEASQFDTLCQRFAANSAHLIRPAAADYVRCPTPTPCMSSAQVSTTGCAPPLSAGCAAATATRRSPWQAHAPKCVTAGSQGTSPRPTATARRRSDASPPCSMATANNISSPPSATAVATKSCSTMQIKHITSRLGIDALLARLTPQQRQKLGEVVRFGIVGVLATLLQYAIYTVLLLWCSPSLSMTVGYILSFIFNFIASTRFTFKVETNARHGAGFALSHVVNYLLQMATLNFFLWIGVSKTLAPIPMFCICVPVNFVLVRFFLKK